MGPPSSTITARMRNGSLSLLDHPGDLVRFACDKFGRSGQYRKQSLIERFGTEIALPDLRHEIAKCERRDKLGDACRIHYVALTGGANRAKSATTIRRSY